MATATESEAAVYEPSHGAMSVLELMAERIRVQILALVADRPANVTSICRALGQTQPAISHHLAPLKLAGLVDATRHGQFNVYEATDLGRRAMGFVRSLDG